LLLKRVERSDVYDDEWRIECDLVFRWRYCGDHRAMEELLRRFKRLIRSVAVECSKAGQLEAWAFKDLLACARLGLIEAATGGYDKRRERFYGYDGRGKFATYARQWMLGRAQEFLHFNWRVVRKPGEWTASRTIPHPGLNPFQNPYSIDYRPANPRHSSLDTNDDDDDSSDGEWVVHAGKVNPDHRFFVAESEMAIERESLALTLEARVWQLSDREKILIRARFPHAWDVRWPPYPEMEEVPKRRNGSEFPEYQPGHKILFPKERDRMILGLWLGHESGGYTEQYVGKIENDALAKLRASNSVEVCSQATFWGPQPYWNALLINWSILCGKKKNLTARSARST
jgi:hypothetical protein